MVPDAWLRLKRKTVKSLEPGEAFTGFILPQYYSLPSYPCCVLARR
jgi:hypothetical protein